MDPRREEMFCYFFSSPLLGFQGHMLPLGSGRLWRDKLSSRNVTNLRPWVFGIICMTEANVLMKKPASQRLSVLEEREDPEVTRSARD